MKFPALLFLLSITLYSQVNYEPVNSSVYDFLERMSVKGFIQLNEEILPFSRDYIAVKLIEIDKSNNRLSHLEKNELGFYIKEFSAELAKKNFDLHPYVKEKKVLSFFNGLAGFDKYDRFRLLNFASDGFNLFIDPAAGFNYELSDDEHSILWSNGLKLYGSVNDNIGFDLQFYDNHLRGDYFDGLRNLSPETGFEFDVGKGGGKDFDRMNANLTYSWSWGNFTAGKDFNFYGSGYNGKLILSGKAPSFPLIKIEAYPVDWFKFSYIHGSMNSRVIDSTSIRLGPVRDHHAKVAKYFVSHMVSFTPFEFINLSLGESVIYSDRFEPIYLIPVAFFRIADHYMTDSDEAAGNAQVFASFWYKSYEIRTKFYASVFIDELSVSSNTESRSVGYNAGVKIVDPLIPESELIAEYTKTDPMLYFHADQAQTYENYGYQLGHWIGSNADQLYLSLKKRILRGLSIYLNYTYTRKGNDPTHDEPLYQPHHTFLWGNKRSLSVVEVIAEYEFLHNLRAVLSYRYLEERFEESRTGEPEPRSFFRFGLNYNVD